MGRIGNPQTVRKIRRLLVKRDGLRCFYCKRGLTHDTVTLDHIIPFSQGGLAHSSNLLTACRKCNNDRGDTDFFEYARQHNIPDHVLRKIKKYYLHNVEVLILQIADNLVFDNAKIYTNVVDLAFKQTKFDPKDFNIDKLRENCGLIKHKGYSGKKTRMLIQNRLIKVCSEFTDLAADNFFKKFN